MDDNKKVSIFNAECLRKTLTEILKGREKLAGIPVKALLAY